MALSLRLLPLAVLLCALAADASANQLHYIPLNNDPIYAPRIVDVVDDPNAPLHEWIILSGLNDEDYFGRSGTTVTYTRPELVPLSDTTAVFDARAKADHTNPRATAFYEFEVSGLAARESTSLEIGLTDLINFVRWSEAQQTIRSDIDDETVTGNTPRWNAFGTFPYRVQVYYHFVDFTVTFVLVDDQLGPSAPISWQAALEPFVNFYDDGIGGTDPDNVIIYPFVSCQVDCTLTVLDWTTLNCDTVGGAVDIDGCAPLPAVGNGVVDPGETCDDGNLVPGDGCDENGQLEKIGRKCQEAIGKAGEKYVKDRLKTLQRCRNLLNEGRALFQDRDETLAISDRSECPSEFRIAGKLAKARGKVRKRIAAKCTDALVGALPTCGESVDALALPDGTAGCIVETHDAAVDDLLAAQYGS